VLVLFRLQGETLLFPIEPSHSNGNMKKPCFCQQRLKMYLAKILIESQTCLCNFALSWWFRGNFLSKRFLSACNQVFDIQEIYISVWRSRCSRRFTILHQEHTNEKSRIFRVIQHFEYFAIAEGVLKLGILINVLCSKDFFSVLISTHRESTDNFVFVCIFWKGKTYHVRRVLFLINWHIK